MIRSHSRMRSTFAAASEKLCAIRWSRPDVVSGITRFSIQMLKNCNTNSSINSFTMESSIHKPSIRVTAPIRLHVCTLHISLDLFKNKTDLQTEHLYFHSSQCCGLACARLHGSHLPEQSDQTHAFSCLILSRQDSQPSRFAPLSFAHVLRNVTAS